MTVIQEVKSLRSEVLTALARIEAKIDAVAAKADRIWADQENQQNQIDVIISDVQAIKAAVTSQPATGLKMLLGNAEKQ